MRDKNPTVDLAFYAYRDMTRCDWRPFVKAASNAVRWRRKNRIHDDFRDS
jgi:hypothetical protein